MNSQYKNKNQLERMSKLEKDEDYLKLLYALLKKGKPVQGLISNLEDKVAARKRSVVIC